MRTDLEAEALAKAARMTEDQERKRIEFAKGNGPQPPIRKETKTQVATPKNEECAMTSLKREIEGQLNQMTDHDETEGDAETRRVITNI